MTQTVITYCPTVSRARNSGAVDGFLGAVVKGKPEVSYNTSRNDNKGRKLPDGIELRFGDARPTAEVREKLKEHGFRFSEKQVIWYAKDNPKARQLVESLEVEEWDVDTTVYEKHSFWAKVRSMAEYHALHGRVEFMVTGSSNWFCDGKKMLERTHSVVSLVSSNRLKFKKFFNKAVGEGGEEGESPEEDGLPDGDGGEEGEDDENEDDGGEIPEMPEDEGDDGEDGNGGDDNDRAGKLARAAAAMQPLIDHKLNPPIARQNRTRRRQGIIDSLRAEGMHLERIQSVLQALSAAFRDRRMDKYPLLRTITGKSQVELLLSYSRFVASDTQPDSVRLSLEHNQAKLNRLNVFTRFDWFDTYQQVIRLLKDESPAPDPKRQLAQELERMIDAIRFKDFPGFFPTPDNEIDRMIELASIHASDKILDPSAGIGNILDRVAAKRGGETEGLDAVEIQNELEAILRKKGYSIVGNDFLTIKPSGSDYLLYDKVMMNPPFENGQDVEHFNHALNFLRAGGRIVAIIGAGAFFRDFKRDQAFRSMLANRHAWVSAPVKDAFKTAFNPTGVTVRMVVVNEDGGKPLLGGRQITDVFGGEYWTSQSEPKPNPEPNPSEDETDMALLELEAEAEIELLKMRLETERRKKRGDSGLNGIRARKIERLRYKAWEMQDKSDVMDFN